MTIELTETQLRTLDLMGVPARVVDARTNAGYFLLPQGEYELVREAVEDDRRQRAIRRVGLRNAAARAMDEP